MPSIYFIEEKYTEPTATEIIDFLDISSVIFTRYINENFINKLYVRGLSFIQVISTDASIPLETIDIIVMNSKESMDSKEPLLNLIYFCTERVFMKKKNNEEINEEINCSWNSSEKFMRFMGSYENLRSIASSSSLVDLDVNNNQDKFLQSMEKEASRVIYAENREKYKQKMRQNSLSNRKSVEKNKSLGKDIKDSKDPKDPKDSKKPQVPKSQVPKGFKKRLE
jgi:hypothetical protein